MKDLKDTINLMMSDDYKERFKAEYHQTKIRYEKLKCLCNQIEAASITNRPEREPKHICPIYLLRDQQKRMGDYLEILEMRAIIEEIDLME